MNAADVDLVYREFTNHASFCRSSLTVETEGKELVPMVLGPGQLRLEAAIRKQRQKGVPVRLIFLKSRRIQATTGTAAQFFHSTAFRAGVHTAVIAHDDTSTQNIFGIYKRFHQTYRPFAGVIKLPVSKDRTRHRDDPGLLGDRIYYEYGGDAKSSFIQVKTAGSANFGRSFRLTNVHFSEFPYYERPSEILSSVMSAVPKLADTCAVIEGTAKTIGDTFNRMWQAAMDPSVESDWVGLFMGWWEHPSNRMDASVAPERFMNSLTPEEREIMGRFNLDLPQLAWRRWTIQNDFNGDTVRFQREHPATPEEAFTASSRNRFSVPHINRQPIQREPLTGELQAEVVGVENRLVFLPGERGALRVWKRPEKGRLYALGADCAQGIDVAPGDGRSDPDYSTGQVLDRDTGEQVAVLRARLMPGETGRYIAALGRWYNMAQICGERNPGGGGISMLEAILNADYPAALIYHRSVTADQQPQVRSDRIGWDTTGVSRPILLSLLDEALRQGSITIRDPLTQQELLTFVIRANGKAEAQAGCFTPGTLILLPDGSVTPISRINPLHLNNAVITHKGVRQLIEKAMVREYKGELIQIKASGLPQLIEATPEHPFLAKRRVLKKNYMDSKAGDRLKSLPHPHWNREFPTEWVEARELRSGDWLAVPKRKRLRKTELSTETLWAFGFWLAEGCYMTEQRAAKRRRGLLITNTNRAFLERAGAALLNQFPLDSVMDNKTKLEVESASHFRIDGPRQRPLQNSKPVYELSFYSRPAAEYFLKTFGEGCEGKSLGADLFQRSGLTALVSGFIDGDGSQRSNAARDVNIYSTSERMAWQFRQILLDSGIWCTLHQQKKRANRWSCCYVLNVKASYLHLLPSCKVEIPAQRLLRHVQEDKDYFYTPVRAVGAREYEGPVHNFSVATDNSYVAGGVAVHNCHDDLVIGLALALVVITKMPRPIPIAAHGIAPPVMGRYGQRPDTDRRGTNVRVR